MGRLVPPGEPPDISATTGELVTTREGCGHEDVTPGLDLTWERWVGDPAASSARTQLGSCNRCGHAKERQERMGEWSAWKAASGRCAATHTCRLQSLLEAGHLEPHRFQF